MAYTACFQINVLAVDTSEFYMKFISISKSLFTYWYLLRPHICLFTVIEPVEGAVPTKYARGRYSMYIFFNIL